MFEINEKIYIRNSNEYIVFGRVFDISRETLFINLDYDILINNELVKQIRTNLDGTAKNNNEQNVFNVFKLHNLHSENYDNLSWDELQKISLSQHEYSTISDEKLIADFYYFYERLNKKIIKANISKISEYNNRKKIYAYNIFNDDAETFSDIDDLFDKDCNVLLVRKTLIDNNVVNKKEHVIPDFANMFKDAKSLTNEEIKCIFKKDKKKYFQGENKMRKTVKVELFDNDMGLDAQYSLVASFENVIIEDRDNIIIQEIIMNNDIAEKIKTHNEVRTKQKDLEILRRTGNKVNLEPVKLKQLTWLIDGKETQ